MELCAQIIKWSLVDSGGTLGPKVLRVVYLKIQHNSF